MIPFFLRCPSGSTVAAMFEPAAQAHQDTGVLLVPPFGWDDQTMYRPRRELSVALARAGFGNLRIDLPGTGDSSGTSLDEGLVDKWTEAVSTSIEWLVQAGAKRIAVIAIGSGGLVTLKAIAAGSIVHDLVLWGTPANGSTFVRELKAFAKMEAATRGSLSVSQTCAGVLAGGHFLTAETLADLTACSAGPMLKSGRPERALVLGRDGREADRALVTALRAAGSKLTENPGHGWGEALATPQTTLPKPIVDDIGSWLLESSGAGDPLTQPQTQGFMDLRIDGQIVRETPTIFEHGGHKLFAIAAVPLNGRRRECTLVLFNAGAIRRIGPNRMWTECARRWAARGVPVIRLDVEGIGDADGNSEPYVKSDDPFYTPRLIDQTRAVLNHARALDLPDRFVVGGLCTGGFWGFQLAIEDPRVQEIIALNPRMLVFDPDLEARRDLRRLRELTSISGLRRMISDERKLIRMKSIMRYILKFKQYLAPGLGASDELTAGVRTLRARQQNMRIGFSNNEPLHEELRRDGRLAVLQTLGVALHALPCETHTLRSAEGQQAAMSLIDRAVSQAITKSMKSSCA